MIKNSSFFSEINKTLKDVPALLIVFTASTLFVMNILANKSIDVGVSFISLDAGILVSWIVFLMLDIITNKYGPKHANTISVLSIFISMFFCFIFYLSSILPGIWGEAYQSKYPEIINISLNNTIGGTWYIVLISGFAFTASAFVNNFSNYFIGILLPKRLKDRSRFYIRSYISTCLAQLVDNMLFALLVGHFFFGWTLLQCFSCSLIGMLAELFIEIIFSPIGYKIYKKIKNN